MQQAMVFRTLTAPDQGDYIQQLWWSWKGPFSEDHFREAWRLLAKRHEVLRSGFDPTADKGIAMVIESTTEIPIERIRPKLAGRKVSERKRAEILEKDLKKGFAIDRAPLMRFTLVERGARTLDILWTTHHALFDGRGRLILLEEFKKIYEGLTESSSQDLVAPSRYTDYMEWYAGADFTTSDEFWRNQLADVNPSAPLSLGNPKSSAGKTRQNRTSRILDSRIERRLRAFATRHELSLNTVVQGGWALMLSKMTGEPKVVFGAPRAGRHPPVAGASSMVGVFVNTVPVCINVEGGQSKLNWLRSIRAHWVELRAHEQTPLNRVREVCAWPDGTPLYETLVGFEKYQLSDLLHTSLSGVSWTFQLEATTEIPLTVQVYEGRSIRVEMTTDSDRFEEKAVQRLIGQFETVLGALSHPKDSSLGEISAINAQESATLARWSQRSTDFPSAATIHSLFTRQATAHPKAIALETDDQRVSYGDLETRSNQLAHLLLAKDVRPEDRVGLLFERSIDQVIAILGILKAGAAYLPLDPECPAERLGILLDDAGTRLVVAETHLGSVLDGIDVEVVRPGATHERVVQGSLPTTPPEVCVGPDHLAYVMFTSGSTGRPKGVEVQHRAVVRLLFGVDYVDLGSHRTLLYLAPTAFDASTFEIWGALLHGSRLVVYPDRVPTIQELGKCLKDHGIDTLWLTCSLFNFIVDEAPEILRPVAQLLTGGEALSPPHIARAQAELPGTQLINGYGPTETTTFACCYRIPRGFDSTASTVPIGRPIGNTSCHVLDPRMQPTPIGMIGELFIGGAGVARGYMNRPELTADRFTSSSFTPGDRLYRTGDLVRWNENGLIEYVGRTDNQVKIRGHRIEPGEVESALSRHPAVRQAAVLIEEHEVRGKELVAYVATQAAKALEPRTLKESLSGSMPSYMVPSRIHILDTLPLNANGKIDRIRLSGSHTGVTDPVPAPESEVATDAERRLSKLYAEILGLSRVGATDSFFALGGDSLRASQLIFRMSRLVGIDIGLRDLNRAPDPRRLARLVRERKGRENNHRPPRLVRLRKRYDVPAAKNQVWYYEVTKGRGKERAGTISRAFRIRGKLNLGYLRNAIDLFIARHETMRTVLEEKADGSVTQTVLPEAKVVLQRADLSEYPPRRQLALARARFREDGGTAISLTRAPAIRVRITRFGQGDHFVSLIFPHALFDAVSLALFYREVSAFYGDFANGKTPDWPEPKYHLIDYLAWQNRHHTGEIQQEGEAFWRRTLKALPRDTWFPADGPVCTAEDGTDRTLHFLLPPDLSDAVRDLSRRSGSTVFMTMMAINAVLIQRHTGQSDFLIASVVDRRCHPAAAKVVGHLGSMFYFRARPREDQTFSGFLEASIHEWMEAVQHRGSDIGEILTRIRREENREGEELTPFFIVHGADDPGALRLTSTRVTPIHRHFGAGPNLPKIEIRDTREGISLLLSYRTPTFKKSTILRYNRRYQELIASLVRDSGCFLYELPDYREKGERTTGGITKIALDESAQSPAPLPEKTGKTPSPSPKHPWLFRRRSRRTASVATR